MIIKRAQWQKQTGEIDLGGKWPDSPQHGLNANSLFCFGFSFKIESTLEKKKRSIEHLCLSRFKLYGQFTNKAYTRFKLTSDSDSHISPQSHRKLFSYNFGKTAS